jgi:hypothetical protein
MLPLLARGVWKIVLLVILLLEVALILVSLIVLRFGYETRPYRG